MDQLKPGDYVPSTLHSSNTESQVLEKPLERSNPKAPGFLQKTQVPRSILCQQDGKVSLDPHFTDCLQLLLSLDLQ